MASRPRIASVALVLLAALASRAVIAQGSCGDIVFSRDITSRFPRVRDACLEIVERKGQPYAHFKARITRVSGDTVGAEFKQPDGSYSRAVQFQPEPNARVRIAGQTYRYRDLSPGQELDVYVPPDRWAFAVYEPEVDFVVAEVVELVALDEPQPALAANLPHTASSLPLVGLAGLLLAGLAAIVRLIRVQA
jgi:hypothetical protein